jgi:uncharacterized protein DUF4345
MQSLSSSPGARAAGLTTGIWALAGVQAVIGLAQVLAPGSFYDAIANFGPRNDHFLRDVASYYLASAVALAVAARQPSWRAPVLALVGVQYLLHAIGHVADAGDADPSWVGPFDVATLAIGVLLIAGLYREASR